MLGYGVDSIDKDGKLNTDGPEAIAAAEMYQKLVRDCGPAGCRRLQLVRMPGAVHAGQGGDLDRHVVGGRGDRRSREVEDRQQSPASS